MLFSDGVPPHRRDLTLMEETRNWMATQKVFQIVITLDLQGNITLCARANGHLGVGILWECPIYKGSTVVDSIFCGCGRCGRIREEDESLG